VSVRHLRDARLPLIVIALALAVLTFWSLHRFRRYQPLADFGPAVPPSSLDGIGLQIRDATITGREGGQLRWRVVCGTITLSHDRRRVTVDDIRHGTLYDTSHRPAVSVQAGHATYRTFFGELTQTSGMPATGILHLSGGIEARVLVGPGVTLQGRELTWDALHNTVTCPGQMQARFTSGSAVGQDLTIDAHSGDLSLRSLHGTFVVPAEVEGFMLRKPSPRAALAVGGSLALLGAAHAATAPTQYVTYAAGFSRWLNAPHTVEMSQGVTFTQDDAVLKTEAAVVNLDDQQRVLNAKSQSPVHLYNTQDDLTGRQGYIDFTRHLATLQDTIVLVVKPGQKEANAPKGTARSQFRDPATLTCSQMTYDYRRKMGHIPGELTIHQKDRVLTADSGEYDAGKETVTLNGHVHGHNGTDEIQTSKVIINLSDTEGAESITIPVPLIGRWVVKDQEDEPEPTPPVPPAPTQSPTPSSPSDTPMTPNSPPPAAPPAASPH
jgi:hypothetical protein